VDVRWGGGVWGCKRLGLGLCYGLWRGACGFRGGSRALLLGGGVEGAICLRGDIAGVGCACRWGVGEGRGGGGYLGWGGGWIEGGEGSWREYRGGGGGWSFFFVFFCCVGVALFLAVPSIFLVICPSPVFGWRIVVRRMAFVLYLG